MRCLLFISCFSFFLSACKDQGPFTHLDQIDFQERALPAGAGAEFPQLYVQDTKLFMSWTEEREDSSYLKYSAYSDGSWSASQTIAKGTDWFVNWADFPEIFLSKDGSTFAHHLQKTGEDTYAYGVEISRKTKNTESFQAIGNPYEDTSKTEHGFVSFFSLPKGENALVWLDGRKYKTEQKEMSLRTARIGKDGKFYEEEELDGRSCDCCQTDAVGTKNGAIVVYRDRSEKEIRDIYAARYENGNWAKPYPVAEDGWEINGCPVNGPAISAAGEDVAVAWYTAAAGQAKVKLAFSENEGKSFGTPFQLDIGNPLGRVDVWMTENAYAYVSWMEKDESDQSRVMIRAVHKNGEMSSPKVVGKISGARASGFPILAMLGKELILAWTEDTESPQLVMWTAETVY